MYDPMIRRRIFSQCIGRFPLKFRAMASTARFPNTIRQVKKRKRSACRLVVQADSGWRTDAERRNAEGYEVAKALAGLSLSTSWEVIRKDLHRLTSGRRVLCRF